MRHGIKLNNLHGEAGCVNLSTLEGQRKSLRELLRKNSPSKVFNMDETGIFFRMQRSSWPHKGQGEDHGLVVRKHGRHGEGQPDYDQPVPEPPLHEKR